MRQSDRSASAGPDRAVLHFEGRGFSYREVDEISGRVAAALRATGLERGDKVAVQLPNIPQFVFAYFAVLKAGLVMLAAISSGFRDLLEHRGRLTDGIVVRSMVPISVRAKDERGTLNNQVAAVFVDLPAGEPDPVARLTRMRRQMDDYKSALGAVDARGMRSLYAYVPIGFGSRVSIGIYSYLDSMTFGLNVDFDAFPDVDVLAEGIRNGLDELAAAPVDAVRPAPVG